jgi:hypothetical protein
LIYRPHQMGDRVKFTCPRCGAVSYHPKDEQHGYCGACHDFTGPTDEQAATVAKLVREISAILTGHPPEVQSGALADLTAMWLGGMQDLERGESSEIFELRESLFVIWCDTVRKLVPVNAAMIRERYLRERSGHA